MSLKERINKEFVTAFKAKNLLKKDTLGILKTKITEAEKKNKISDLSDTEIYSVVSTLIKQRKDAIEIYSKNDSAQAKLNAEKEANEIVVLKDFLPKQLTIEEIEKEILCILKDMIYNSEQEKNVVSGIMKYFSANYKGQYDGKLLKEIADGMIINSMPNEVQAKEYIKEFTKFRNENK